MAGDDAGGVATGAIIGSQGGFRGVTAGFDVGIHASALLGSQVKPEIAFWFDHGESLSGGSVPPLESKGGITCVDSRGRWLEDKIPGPALRCRRGSSLRAGQRLCASSSLCGRASTLPGGIWMDPRWCPGGLF